MATITRPLRIGLIGKMRAGKDTAAAALIREFDGSILKFADPLYEMQTAIYEILGQPVEGEKDRRLLQLLGTEWGREKDPDIWVKTLIRRAPGFPGNVYVTDVRFPNEAKALHEAGYTIFRIERPDSERIAAGAFSEGHASETSINNIPDECITETILNTGTIQEFYDAVVRAVKVRL